MTGPVATTTSKPEPGYGRAKPALFLAVLLAGCGTHVDAGDNLAKSRAQSGDAIPGEDPAVPAGTVGADGSPSGGDPGTAGGGTTGTTTGGQALTCFGPAPALSADFQAFCAVIDDDTRATFKTAVDAVCTDHRLVNLALAPCGWDGTGASDRFRRVLAKTDLTDTATTDFSFFAAYSVTSKLKLEDHLTLLFSELKDPVAYDARYVKIRNSRVYDTQPRDDGGYDYSVDFASSAATVSFRATVRPEKITDNLTVVYDYAIGNEVLIKEHHFLRFLLRGAGNTTRLIGIDEKLLADAGNHQIAYQNLTDVLQQRQERDYVNSTR